MAGDLETLQDVGDSHHHHHKRDTVMGCHPRVCPHPNVRERLPFRPRFSKLSLSHGFAPSPAPSKLSASRRPPCLTASDFRILDWLDGACGLTATIIVIFASVPAVGNARFVFFYSSLLSLVHFLSSRLLHTLNQVHVSTGSVLVSLHGIHVFLQPRLITPARAGSNGQLMAACYRSGFHIP